MHNLNKLLTRRNRPACAALLTAAALAFSACGSDDNSPSADTDAESMPDSSFETGPRGPSLLEKSAGLWVQLDAAKGELTLRNGDATVLQIAGPDGNGIAFRNGSASVQYAFGSFKFEETAQPPWIAVKTLTVQAALPSLATLQALGADGKPLADISIERSSASFRIKIEPTTAYNRSTIAYGCAADEHFLGLGGQSFDVDHRGHRAALWVEEDGIGKFPTEEAGDSWFLNGKRHQSHTPMPIYLSSKGYAVILRSDHRVVADLCKSQAQQVRWENWHANLDLQVLVAATPLELQRALGKTLGTPDVLPGWALVPWLDAIYGSENVRRIAKKLKDGGYPVSALWSEDWRGGVKSASDYTLDEDWLADAKLYPDLDQLSKDLHGLGYKFLTYNNTFLTSDADIFDQAKQKGYGIRKADGSMYTFTGAKFVAASLLDLWNPEARAWGKEQYATGLAAGADGWMADFCEWLPTDAVMADGTLGLDRHQQYAVECQKLNRELFEAWHAKDGVERLFFVRSAWLGSQPLVSVVWGGDQQTDFSQGDGLPSVIPIGLGLGVTGFPYYGHDIAGYASTGAPFTDKELFFRWVTLGALSPVMRTHHGKFAQGNWQWESDAESEAHMLQWTRFHTALWPYLWMLAQDPQLPMMRTLALHYPEFAPGWTRTDQYLLGDRLLVAPIVEQGKTQRKVSLPQGNWYPFDQGAAVAGPAELSVDASLTQIPLFVPAGTLLPLIPEAGLRKWSERLASMPVGSALKQEALGLEVRIWPGQSAGNVGSYDGAFGQLNWQGKDWSGACKTATWNGKEVSIVQGAIEVQGSGELVVDGQGKLQVGPAGNPHTAKGLKVRCPKP